MFKSFSRKQEFHGFTRSVMGMNLFAEAYGIGGCNVWFDAADGTDGLIDGQNISYWKDKVQEVTFNMGTLANQPRWLDSDVNFGGNPVVDFYTQPRGLRSQRGFTVTSEETIVMVYQYYSLASGSSSNSRIIGDGNISSPRTSGDYLGHHRNNNSSQFFAPGSYTNGSGVALASTEAYTLLPCIIIYNNDRFFFNGVEVTKTGAQIKGFTATEIGSISSVFVGMFKMAEFLKFNRKMSELEVLDLSNSLNIKYAIY